jgi:tripartite-type tricarboxylate transporter receptor subunit TctC
MNLPVLNPPFDSEKDSSASPPSSGSPYLLSQSLPVKSRRSSPRSQGRPGAIDYGSGGVGNATHIAGERFAAMAGVKLNHVPYRGVGPSITALLAGEVQVLYASSVAVQPYIGSGRMRVLAATGDKRIAQMPDVPTVQEAGVPGYVEGNWQAVLVPAKTPRPLVNRLSQELVHVVKSADVSAQIVKVGGRGRQLPGQTNALIRRT